MNGLLIMAPLCAGACAGLSGAITVRLLFEHVAARRRIRSARVKAGIENVHPQKEDLPTFLVNRAVQTGMNMASRSQMPLSLAVRNKRAATTRAARFVEEHVVAAGYEEELTCEGFCEYRARLSFAGLAGGAVLGSLFSWEFSLVLGLIGFWIGWKVLNWAITSIEKERALEAEAHLAEMLDVVALGLRSGLTFDKSFYLYGTHFDSVFAKSCVKAHERWTMGIVSREDALRALSRSFACESLARALETVVRSLRFGSSFAESLEEMAVQSRGEYRSKVEERVAKAPVKMMVPTGTLILPAMLLLVMGPILLKLGGGL